MGSRRSEAATPSVLISYYSMTGNTRRLAEEIQRATGGKLQEIREPRPRRGLAGVMRALFDALSKRLPPIEPPTLDPADFDLLVLGGPVWARRMASPVRAFACRYGRHAQRIAMFCTEGGKGSDLALADLEALCGRERCASLTVDAQHLDAHGDALADFVRDLNLAEADASAWRRCSA
jgi:flavodoxin